MNQFFSTLLVLILVFAGVWIYDDLSERKLHEFLGINNIIVNSDNLSDTDEDTDDDINTDEDIKPYVVQNGLKLVYDIKSYGLNGILRIGLVGCNGKIATYGYAYDWDIYLDDEFYDNYSGITAIGNCITITGLERGEHIVCMEDKTGNDYCARSINFFNIDPCGLTEVYGYGNAYNGSFEMPEFCYYGQFRNCEELIIGPELPATILANYCYGAMFYKCENLEIAPKLFSIMLADFCYAQMFEGCINLTSVTCYYPFNLESSFAGGWLKDIPTTGTLKSPNAVITYGLPENWIAEAI